MSIAIKKKAPCQRKAEITAAFSELQHMKSPSPAGPASSEHEEPAATLPTDHFLPFFSFSRSVSPTTRMPAPLYGSGGLIFRILAAI